MRCNSRPHGEVGIDDPIRNLIGRVELRHVHHVPECEVHLLVGVHHRHGHLVLHTNYQSDLRVSLVVCNLQDTVTHAYTALVGCGKRQTSLLVPQGAPGVVDRDQNLALINKNIDVVAHLIAHIKPVQLFLPDSLDERFEARLEGSRSQKLYIVDVKGHTRLDFYVLVCLPLVLRCRLDSRVREGVRQQTRDHLMDSTQTVLGHQLVDNLVLIEVFNIECESASCFEPFISCTSIHLNVPGCSFDQVHAYRARRHRENVTNSVSTRCRRDEALHVTADYALHDQKGGALPETSVEVNEFIML